MDVRVGTCVFATRHRGGGGLELAELRCGRPLDLDRARRLRREAPSRFEFVLETPAAITRRDPFADTPATHRVWKTTLELARALDAPIVLFRPPAAFRPDDESVSRLIRFFEWAHRDRIRFGWEPRGDAWTDELVRTLCVELSLLHVVDPFERRCLRPRPPYYRLRGHGPGHRYTDGELETLRDLCTEPLTYCVFANASRAVDARRFAALRDRVTPCSSRCT